MPTQTRSKRKTASRSPLARRTIGIIGGGNMAEALVRGLLASKATSAKQMTVSEPRPGRRRTLGRKYGVAVTADNSQAAAASIVVFAVKPQVIDAVCGALGPLPAKTLVLSIAAGVRLARLEKSLGPRVRLVRVMPNTPALIGSGISVYYPGPRVTGADRRYVKALLGAVGSVVEIRDEKLMDTVTGLSGSGPAYVYLVIDALAKGGEKMGLSRELALRLAAETVVGAGQMVAAGVESPEALIRAVSSPGGTTVAGLAVLNDARVEHAFRAAVQAATRRAREL